MRCSPEESRPTTLRKFSKLAAANGSLAFQRGIRNARYGGRAERRMKISLRKGIVATFEVLGLTVTESVKNSSSNRRVCLLHYEFFGGSKAVGFRISWWVLSRSMFNVLGLLVQQFSGEEIRFRGNSTMSDFEIDLKRRKCNFQRHVRQTHLAGLDRNLNKSAGLIGCRRSSKLGSGYQRPGAQPYVSVLPIRSRRTVLPSKCGSAENSRGQ